MKQLLERLRTFLIKTLAGDDMVIVNADIRGCALIGGKGSRTLMIGGRFTGAADQPTISPLPREIRDAHRKRVREANKQYRELKKKFSK